MVYTNASKILVIGAVLGSNLSEGKSFLLKMRRISPSNGDDRVEVGVSNRCVSNLAVPIVLPSEETIFE